MMAAELAIVLLITILGTGVKVGVAVKVEVAEGVDAA